MKLLFPVETTGPVGVVGVVDADEEVEVEVDNEETEEDDGMIEEVLELVMEVLSVELVEVELLWLEVEELEEMELELLEELDVVELGAELDTNDVDEVLLELELDELPPLTVPFLT